MATIGYASLPVPAGGSAPVVPGDFAALATAVDKDLPKRATSRADRDARFAALPAGSIVTAPDGTLWTKTSAGWLTVNAPITPWDRTVSLKSGFQQGDSALGLMVVDSGRRVELKGRIERVDGTNIYDANAVNFGSVPSDLIPPSLRTLVTACSMAGATTDAAGRLEVLGTNSTSAYGQPGDLVWWYQGEGGTSWVDISGYYWLI
ncbi:hypothetical protein [Streptomyces sp. SPB78]|uniref:hypothetical protein n=1 Tax=Streptomyces sp. (strain SPB78) TaxID=591157 RepID=UPI0001B56979|nr:hypothetical protein [Streptomyces sp. SPB78]